MPTGFTATLAEGPQDITDFLKDLARGMGFLIMQRDEPWETPLPDEILPSKYYEECLAKSRERMKKLNNVTAQEAETLAAEAFRHEHGLWKGRQDQQAETAARYRDMIKKLEQWTPTHHAMKGLKEFGLRQLNESLNFDCGYSGMPEPTPLSGEEWLKREIEAAQKAIERDAVEHAREVERANGRNDALQALHAKLKAFSQTREVETTNV